LASSWAIYWFLDEQFRSPLAGEGIIFLKASATPSIAKKGCVIRVFLLALVVD
jgi:hypothetical protein